MAFKKKHSVQHWEIIAFWLILFDVSSIVFSYFLALWFRFDCKYSAIPEHYFNAYLKFIFWYLIVCVVVFFAMRLYQSVWRFASYSELIRVVAANILTGMIHTIFITAFVLRMPISYYVFGAFFQFCFTLGIRFSYRFVLLLKNHREVNKKNSKRVMIIGAGEAGQMILRDIRHSRNEAEMVCCFIDDNENKHGRFIDGVKVVGGMDSILSACAQYQIEKIYLAIPSITMAKKREILNICNESGCQMMVLPGIYQLRSGNVTVNSFKNVQIEDLLGRDSIKVNLDEIYHQLEGKSVLITGGGGSIGSELARQIASHNPYKLILFDIYENSLYDIQQELIRKFPYLKLETLVGSVRDSRRIFQIFETYKPDMVFHAAAHKHVPLMEESPCEAIKNNALGTYKTAYAAMANGCKRFVLISTDKAVNPTNVMGATKRICEMIIQTFDEKIKKGEAEKIPQLFIHEVKKAKDYDKIMENVRASSTEFVAVRFGNVLGSNGSVVPLFKKQIENGGPVTVTHPDIVRYFMTIPEAVSLVLQAASYAKGGEIFVLDMGDPVKIDSLARNLIHLLGYKPDVDIKIEYTGLRPGEKLFEEKLMDEEGLKKTENDLIHIARPIEIDYSKFIEQLKQIMDVAYNNDSDIIDCIGEIVDTYKPNRR